jgi:hypothetical protein
MDSTNLYHNANAGVRVQSRPSSIYISQRMPQTPLAPSLQYSRPPMHAKSSSQKISHPSSDSKILPPINSYNMSSIGSDGSPVINGSSDGQVNGGGSAGNSMPGSNAPTPLTVHTPVSTSSSIHADPSAFSSQQQQATNGLGMAPYQQQNTMYSTAPPSATTPQSANGMNSAFSAVSSPFDQAYGRMYPTASPSSTMPPSQSAYATTMAPAQNAYASAEAYRQVQGQNGNLPRINAAPTEQAFYQQQQQQQQQQLRQQQQQLAMAQQQEGEPVHVVGQQGRRGVLPTAGDKPPPVGGAKFIVPPKDKEGRFPCPFCQKTYQHAKHLKRHNLRHTGDRPYTCKLCKDTFSRSDILKRHFQKCSIRRGVPSDTDHLEGSRAHQQRNNRLSLSQQLASSNISPDAQSYLGSAGSSSQNPYQPPLMNGISNFLQNQGQAQPFDQDTMEAISNRSSRANSIMRPQGLENGQAVSAYQENFQQQSMAGLQPGTVSYALPSGSSAYPYGPVVTTSDANSAYKSAPGDSANALFNGQHPQMMGMALTAQQAAAWGIQAGVQNGIQNSGQNGAQGGMQNGMQNAGAGYPSNGTASSQQQPPP